MSAESPPNGYGLLPLVAPPSPLHRSQHKGWTIGNPRPATPKSGSAGYRGAAPAEPAPWPGGCTRAFATLSSVCTDISTTLPTSMYRVAAYFPEFVAIMCWLARCILYSVDGIRLSIHKDFQVVNKQSWAFDLTRTARSSRMRENSARWRAASLISAKSKLNGADYGRHRNIFAL
jgi:hypothetical protein